MARITRSKKVSTLEDQTYSPKTQNNSTTAQTTRILLHPHEIDVPLEKVEALAKDASIPNKALEMKSENTNRKCKLAIRSFDKSTNDFSNSRSSITQVTKLAKNKDVDLNTKRPKKTNANETRYLAKDASPRSIYIDSNKNNHNSSHMGKEQTVTVDSCSISESSMINEINPGSVKIDEGEDSFIAQIINRSPAKPVSRFEDSVEELDRLETALEVLSEVAHVENMIEHNLDPKHKLPATPNMRPSVTRKVVSAFRPDTSSIPSTKIQSPAKIKNNSLPKETLHNDFTHPAQNLELQRKKLPNSTAINSNKSHIRPTQVHSKKAYIKPLKDHANTTFSKSKFTKVIHQVSNTGPPKVKESKSSSNLNVLNPDDNVFTRLSTGTYKSRSSSRKTDEKVTQAARDRKSCHVSHLLSHRATNSTPKSSDLSREKDTCAHLSRPLKTQTSRKNLQKTMPGLVSSRDYNPPLTISSKQALRSESKTKLGRDIKSTAVGETQRREKTPHKDIERKLEERKNAALLARAEAAEKGRRAVMEWAERHKTK